MATPELLCPFCNGVLDEDMYNGMYGCDTGCSYISIEIECPHCRKVAWSSGTFGEFDADDREECREGFIEDFHAEMLRLAQVASREGAPS